MRSQINVNTLITQDVNVRPRKKESKYPDIDEIMVGCNIFYMRRINGRKRRADRKINIRVTLTNCKSC